MAPRLATPPALEDLERSAERRGRTFLGIATATHVASVAFHFAGSASTREFGRCAGRYEEDGPCEAGALFSLGYSLVYAVSWAQAGASLVLAGLSGANFGRRDLLRAGLRPSEVRGRRFRIAGGTVLGLSLVGFAASRAVAIPALNREDGPLCGTDVTCRVAFRESTFWAFSAGAIVGAGMLGYGLKRDWGLKKLREQRATVGFAPLASPRDGAFGLTAHGRF